MSERYFVESPISGSAATLADAEAHHLAHVMRAKPGERVVLFDGTGGEYTAEITRVGRAAIDLAVLSHDAVERELPLSLTVGVSLPKGDRQRWLIEKLTELGCAAVVPLITTRGVAQPTAGALDRLRRAVIEASKQCGRNRLMQIASAQTAADFFALSPARSCRLIAQPHASHQLGAMPAPLAKAARAEGCVIAVGPEGGFTDEEVQAAIGAGWTAVDLGARILRVETAAVAIASATALLFAAEDV